MLKFCPFQSSLRPYLLFFSLPRVMAFMPSHDSSPFPPNPLPPPHSVLTPPPLFPYTFNSLSALQVAVRCGDSPTKQNLRPSDGIFSMEVTLDDPTTSSEKGSSEPTATFHMKSFFFNSSLPSSDPNASKPASMPAVVELLHREYAKLWMETSVRRLMK